MTCKSYLMSSSQKHGYTVLFDNFIFCLLSKTIWRGFSMPRHSCCHHAGFHWKKIKAEFKDSALDTVKAKC